jgi:hypothetical protein
MMFDDVLWQVRLMHDVNSKWFTSWKHWGLTWFDQNMGRFVGRLGRIHMNQAMTRMLTSVEKRW